MRTASHLLRRNRANETGGVSATTPTGRNRFPGLATPTRAFWFLGLRRPLTVRTARAGYSRVTEPAASGDFLMAAMHQHGFANIPTSQSIDDGLTLTDAYIAAAVRCAPPDNKPTPEEIHACQPHLEAELAHLPNVRVVVALGKIAFDVWWKSDGRRRCRQ